jgi:hypothetical protein
MDKERVDERLGKAVNQYLNHYVLVIDTKAAAIAAASLVIVGFVTSPAASNLDTPWNLVGGALAVVAAIVAGSVLYPRTPRFHNGHLFWFDIRNFASPTEYWKSLAALDDDAVGLEYARQNFNLSGVLVDKTRRVQIALWLVSFACVVLAVAYLAE